MKCFKMFGLLFASLAMLAMVGCGGGGGGSSSPATQNPTLNVSIPGGPFQQTTASFRAVQIADELVVKVEAYEKGVKKSSGIEDRKATYNKNTDKYECSITVLPGVEYRLIAYLNGKPVMSNQIAASKVQNNATITIDATTTLRTQVYDKWKDSSTNKSFSNFVKNCEKKGIDIDKAADIATLSGVSTTDFETELKKVANNDKSAQLPEVNTVDVSKIGTEDLETSTPAGSDEEGLTSEFINLTWKSLPSLDDLGSVEGFEETDYVYDGHFTALHDNDVVKIVAEGVLDNNVRKWTVIAENERDNYKFIDNFYFMHIDNSEFNAKMYFSIFFSEVGGRNLSWYSAVKDSSNTIFFKVTDGVADVVYSATQHDDPQNLATLQVYVAKDDAGHIYAKLIDKASNKSRILRIYSK